MLSWLGSSLCAIALSTALFFIISFHKTASFRQQATFCAQLESYYALIIRVVSAATALAFLVLILAFLGHDFSIAYVMRHSHHDLPWYYRIGAVWGGHEGSFLLWMTVLSLWSWLFSYRPVSMPFGLWGMTLYWLAWLHVILMGFLCFTSNPFDPLMIPALEGHDLNPLLQDPGLVVHPPILYTGYVGFAVVFCLALAALVDTSWQNAWSYWAKQWAMAAWTFLTAGILLGSWWSYRVLGWGGWWAWDPVENAAFMPWLTATALIHSLMLTVRDHRMMAWTMILSLLTFILCLFGTFLVRSGVLISVHAFAQDPSRGLVLLFFVIVIALCALYLYARQTRKAAPTPEPWYFASRKTLLVINNYLMISATFIMLLGTLYPIIWDAFGHSTVTLGAAYFNTTVTPILACLSLFMACVALVSWQGWQDDLHRHLVPLVVMMVLMVIVASMVPHHRLIMSLLSLMFMSLTYLTLYTTRPWPLARWPMLCAHLGYAMVLLGIGVSSLYSQANTYVVHPQDQLQFAQYQLYFDHFHTEDHLRYLETEVDVTIIPTSGGRPVVLTPTYRLYQPSHLPAVKVGIEHFIAADLYVALSDYIGEGQWVVRLYLKPMISWIWAGGLLMVLSGVLSMYRSVMRRGK